MSQIVSKKCVETYNMVARRQWSEEMIDKAADHLELPVRKLAHFSEYTVMGALVSNKYLEIGTEISQGFAF